MAVNFATTQDKVEALYVGYFSRAADPAGLNYWVSQLNSGANSYAQAAASFSVQPEATSAYPYLANPGTSDAGTFVDQVYMIVFNHAADAAGKAYWVQQLTAAGGNPGAVGQMVLNIISGAQGSDATAVTNKVAVGSHFTNGLVAANHAYDATADAEGRSEVTTTDATPRADGQRNPVGHLDATGTPSTPTPRHAHAHLTPTPTPTPTPTTPTLRRRRTSRSPLRPTASSAERAMTLSTAPSAMAEPIRSIPAIR